MQFAKDLRPWMLEPMEQKCRKHNMPIVYGRQRALWLRYDARYSYTECVCEVSEQFTRSRQNICELCS